MQIATLELESKNKAFTVPSDRRAPVGGVYAMAISVFRRVTTLGT